MEKQFTCAILTHCKPFIPPTLPTWPQVVLVLLTTLRGRDIEERRRQKATAVGRQGSALTRGTRCKGEMKGAEEHHACASGLHLRGYSQTWEPSVAGGEGGGSGTDGETCCEKSAARKPGVDGHMWRPGSIGFDGDSQSAEMPLRVLWRRAGTGASMHACKHTRAAETRSGRHLSQGAHLFDAAPGHAPGHLRPVYFMQSHAAYEPDELHAL